MAEKNPDFISSQIVIRPSEISRVIINFRISEQN